MQHNNNNNNDDVAAAAADKCYDNYEVVCECVCVHECEMYLKWKKGD